MSDWSSRRRVNLSELQRDLAQVAPVEADDFEALADTVTALLKKSQGSELTRKLNKTAIWDRVLAEMDASEGDSPTNVDDANSDSVDPTA